MGDAFGSKPDTVNAQGSGLDEAIASSYGGGISGLLNFKNKVGAMDPEKSFQMLQNWLTAGAPPKPIDPGQIFAEEGTVAAEKERAGAGAGFAGLFGFGNMIGSIAPLNTSPMQPGVPYAAPPVPSGPPDVSGRK